MNILELKRVFLLRKFMCVLFGHKFITKRKVTPHFKEYECSNCHLEVTNDDKGRKTFLTPELKDINETLMVFYKKRHPSV
jgi:hypothetical protein